MRKVNRNIYVIKVIYLHFFYIFHFYMKQFFFNIYELYHFFIYIIINHLVKLLLLFWKKNCQWNCCYLKYKTYWKTIFVKSIEIVVSEAYAMEFILGENGSKRMRRDKWTTFTFPWQVYSIVAPFKYILYCSQLYNNK